MSSSDAAKFDEIAKLVLNFSIRRLSSAHIHHLLPFNSMDLNTGSNSDPHADRYGHRTSFPGSGSLPPSVLSRILDYTIHRIVNQGGADIPYVVNGLARMALVCKVWKRAAYLEREEGWLKAGNERMSNTGYNSALNKQLESSKGGDICVEGGLALVVIDCAGNVANERYWDGHLLTLATGCSATTRLSMEVNNARKCNLAKVFTSSSIIPSVLFSRCSSAYPIYILAVQASKSSLSTRLKPTRARDTSDLSIRYFDLFLDLSPASTCLE